MVKTLFGLLLVVFVLGACNMLIPPKADGDIATYNNQVFQLWMSIITFLGVVATAIGGWVKSNKDKKDLASTHRQEAHLLAKDAHERTEKVLERVDQAKNLNVTAIETANGLNEKIANLQQQLEEALKARNRSGRKTDSQESLVVLPLAAVQKVEVVAGPGVDTPLKVEDSHKHGH